MQARTLLAAAVLTGTTAVAAEMPKLELLSIEGVRLKSNEVVMEFHIDTWGVTPVTVCSIPHAWTITAGKHSDPAGEISGTGDTFGSLLTGLELSKVYVLAEVWGYHAGQFEHQPPTFSGTLKVTAPATTDLNDRTIKLKPSNFVHRPAAACPPIKMHDR